MVQHENTNVRSGASPGRMLAACVCCALFQWCFCVKGALVRCCALVVSCSVCLRAAAWQLISVESSGSSPQLPYHDGFKERLVKMSPVHQRNFSWAREHQHGSSSEELAAGAIRNSSDL